MTRSQSIFGIHLLFVIFLISQIFLTFISTHEKEKRKPFEPPPGFVVAPTNRTNRTRSTLKMENITASEREHIREHLDVSLKTKSNSAQIDDRQLQFHYFKIFDADRNQMLDGIELANSIIDQHEHGGQVEAEDETIYSDAELEYMVDRILSLDDLDNNGFVDWYEFNLAQQRK